jgi:hypothetical protein
MAPDIFNFVPTRLVVGRGSRIIGLRASSCLKLESSKFLESCFEVVKHDVVSETFEDKSQLPVRVDATQQLAC